MWRAALFALLLPAPALAEGRTIIVLDASGSMWGQIDGRAKLEIAREALGQVLGTVDPATELGLIAYGHRSKGECSDIELVVPPGPGTGPAIIAAADAMQFLGKTPLTDAVRQAAADLRSTEAKATVVLITDGVETCQGDPCALGAELEASGIDFTAHVVGFGLTDDEGRAVSCLAENTGGDYIQAGDQAALTDALQTIVIAKPPPPPPEPARVAENVDPVILLAPGGTEPEEVTDAVFDFFPVTGGQPAAEAAGTVYGRSPGQFPPGDYLMRGRLHNAVAELPVTLTDTVVAMPTVVLDAGILALTVQAQAGAGADPDAYWEVNGPGGVSDYGYGQGRRVFPAGEYGLSARLGAAEASQTVTITAGDVTSLDVVLGTGVAALSPWFTDALADDSDVAYVEIFDAATALDGSRTSRGYGYGAGTYDLPPGDYAAYLRRGGVEIEQRFSVATGQRTEVRLVMNAGVAAITTPADEFIEVLATSPDINGDRKSFGYSYGPAFDLTLPVGDYSVLVRRGDAQAEAPLTVRAGERTELALPAP